MAGLFSLIIPKTDDYSGYVSGFRKVVDNYYSGIKYSKYYKIDLNTYTAYIFIHSRLKDSVFSGNIYSVSGCLFDINGKNIHVDNDESRKLVENILINSDDLIRHINGFYVGFVKRNEQLVFFNDILSSIPLYYYSDDGVLVVSTRIRDILETISYAGRTIGLSTPGAYFLLTFGYMIGEATLYDGVKKVLPGSIIVFDKGSTFTNKIYEFNNYDVINADMDEIIGELHRRFSKAVAREFAYDAERGYSHILTLSGGLDSRTVLFYAVSQGFTDITALSFSQTGYLDHVISEKIAKDLGVNYVFVPLEPGDYLYSYADDIIRITGGLIYYVGPIQVYYAMKQVYKENVDYGILHTGQLGDAILGTYLVEPRHTPLNRYVMAKKAISSKLLDKALKYIDTSRYRNAELFVLLERGFNGIFAGFRAIEEFTEFSSPFLQKHFLEYVLRIPPELRYDEYIYIEWLKKYMRSELKYTWESLGFKPIYPFRLYPLLRKINLYRRRLRKILGKEYLLSMNPFEYWFKTNNKLREYIYNTYKENIGLIMNKELRDDVEYLFNNGNFIEKSMVLTLLKSVRIFKVKT